MLAKDGGFYPIVLISYGQKSELFFSYMKNVPHKLLNKVKYGGVMNNYKNCTTFATQIYPLEVKGDLW